MGNCALQNEKTSRNRVPPYHTYSVPKFIFLHYTWASSPYPSIRDLFEVMPEYLISVIHKYEGPSKEYLLVSAMSSTMMVAKVGLILEVVDGAIIAQFGTLNVIEILIPDSADITIKFCPKNFILNELISNLFKLNGQTSNVLNSRNLLRHIKKVMNS